MTRKRPPGRGPQPSSEIDAGNIIADSAAEAWVIRDQALIEEIRAARHARLARLNIIPRHQMTQDECRGVVIFEAMIDRHYRLNREAA